MKNDKEDGKHKREKQDYLKDDDDVILLLIINNYQPPNPLFQSC